MRGYPFVFFYITALFLSLPTGLTKSQRAYLNVGKIKANRASPAFSAIEDAFLLKDFSIKNKIERPARVKKVNLKGLKVTSRNRVRKVALLGERIEVGHFTNKFISKQETRFEKVKIAADYSLGIEGADLSSKFTIKKLSAAPEKFKNNDFRKSELSSAVERVELPSGIVLTKPIDIRHVEQVKRTDPYIGTATSIAYGSNSEVLKGKIELDGGDVSFDRGNYIYYIERKLDGKVYESGTVSAVDESFEIEVANRLGVLGVELRSLKGEVLAYGEKLLAPIDSGKDSSIILYPSEDLFLGRVLADELSKGGVEVAVAESSQVVSGVDGDLKVDKKGYFNESLFEKGSSFVVETKSKGRWPQVSVGISGKPLYSRVLKKKIFFDLSKTADPFGEEIEVQTVLMGEVTQKGLAQREIEIKIFDQDHQKPLYFGQSLLVDHKLSRTSVGGKFAFINLPSGGYLIQAYRGERLLAQKWFIVKEGRVSKGQIELNSKTSVIASTEFFPSRTNVDKSINFSEFGTEADFRLSQKSEAKIDLKSNPEVTIFESEPTEFFARHIYVTASKLLKKRFKLVHKPWLEEFLNTRRSNANRALGIVVGFLPDENFKIVRSTTTSLSNSSNIYYFDKNGESVDEGLAGGGFIITDVKPGVQTTVVSIKRKEVFLNKILVVKPYSISIF